MPEESRNASQTRQAGASRLQQPRVGRGNASGSVQTKAPVLRTTAVPTHGTALASAFPCERVWAPRSSTALLRAGGRPACPVLSAHTHLAGPILRAVTQAHGLHISNELLASRHVRQYADNVITLFHPSEKIRPSLFEPARVIILLPQDPLSLTS